MDAVTRWIEEIPDADTKKADTKNYSEQSAWPLCHQCTRIGSDVALYVVNQQDKLRVVRHCDIIGFYVRLNAGIKRMPIEKKAEIRWKVRQPGLNNL